MPAENVNRTKIAGYCQYVFKSGWAKGMRCTATAWYHTGREWRCDAHKGITR